MYANRSEAGRQLVRSLQHLRGSDVVVLGLPRGGVPVAAGVAAALGAPLDVVVVRKLGAPADPELAVGAIAEGGSLVVDPLLAEHAGVTGEDLDRRLARERGELRRRSRRLRGAHPPADLRGRAALLVAAPVGSAEAVALVRRTADEVVCHTVPPALDGVGRWYRDLSPVSEDEVVALLADERTAA